METERLLERFSPPSVVAAIKARRQLVIAISITCFIFLALILTEGDLNDLERDRHYSHLQASNSTLSNSTITNSTATVLTSTIWVPSTGMVQVGAGYQRPGYELPLANGMPLRIMAIGASTTRGDESFDVNGFRRPVREYLTSIGNPVNFVGAERLGNMTDNDIEAYPGARTEAMHQFSAPVVPAMKPNLVLLNLGANDCFQDWDIPNFYKRYYAFVNDIFAWSPRATIVMATLLPTTETKVWNASARIPVANQQIRRLCRILQRENKPVVLAEMVGPDGIQDGNLAWDGMHPTSAGYEMMGRITLQAIMEADARGFLQPADHVDGIVDDGDEPRIDEKYVKWVEQKKQERIAAERIEEQEIQKMIESLKPPTESTELEKTDQTDHAERHKLRRHI